MAKLVSFALGWDYPNGMNTVTTWEIPDFDKF